MDRHQFFSPHLTFLTTIYTLFSGLFSEFLLLAKLISESSAAMFSRLAAILIGNLLLMVFLTSINNWSLMLIAVCHSQKEYTQR